MRLPAIARALAASLLVVVPSLAAAAVPASDGLEAARLAIRTKQFSQAVRLLQREALAGSADARYLLGLALWNGIGIEADREAARASLRGAADTGHPAAAYALAALLAGGNAGDAAEASKWLARAAAAGYTPAIASSSARTLAFADARATLVSGELRFEIARAAAREDAAMLLSAAGTRELVNRRGDFGRTLLLEAAEAGAAKATQLLLAAGGLPEIADEYGETPLMFAAAQSEVAVTRQLLAAGARANSADRAGRTALFRAAAANLPDQVRELLAAGASIDHSDLRGWTAFDVAQQGNSVRALEVLRAAAASACAAILVSRSTASLRRLEAKGFTCTTSAHGGK